MPLSSTHGEDFPFPPDFRALLGESRGVAPSALGWRWHFVQGLLTKPFFPYSAGHGETPEREVAAPLESRSCLLMPYHGFSGPDCPGLLYAP